MSNSFPYLDYIITRVTRIVNTFLKNILVLRAMALHPIRAQGWERSNAFGVKGFQLNDMEKSTYNNIEQQNRAFYSDTLQNAITEYEQEMDYKLLSSKEQRDGHYWDFNVDVMLRSDIESRYRAYQTGITAGFLKISEARQKENLPFEDGSDRLIIGNGASIPLTDLGKQYSAKEVKNNE